MDNLERLDSECSKAKYRKTKYRKAKSVANENVPILDLAALVYRDERIAASAFTISLHTTNNNT